MAERLLLALFECPLSPLAQAKNFSSLSRDLRIERRPCSSAFVTVALRHVRSLRERTGARAIVPWLSLMGAIRVNCGTARGLCFTLAFASDPQRRTQMPAASRGGFFRAWFCWNRALWGDLAVPFIAYSATRQEGAPSQLLNRAFASALLRS